MGVYRFQRPMPRPWPCALRAHLVDPSRLPELRKSTPARVALGHVLACLASVPDSPWAMALVDTLQRTHITPVLITLGIFALFLILPAIDPLKANIAKFRGSFNMFIVLIVLFILYIHTLTLAWSLGYQNFRMSAAMLPFMGILFIFIGTMLRQAKRNFFIGIRTPWTLSSDSVWDKTHRLGSVLFMISGAFAFIGAFIGGVTAFLLILVPLIGSTLFLVVYSYLLYRSEANV